MNKFMIGVITKDRYNGLESLLISLQNLLFAVIVVDASDNFNNHCADKYIPRKYILNQTKQNAVVYNKNLLMNIFLNSNCDYLFLIEDDVKITNINIFQIYIEICQKYGFYHLCFNGTPEKHKNYILNDDIRIYRRLDGKFCLFTKECLQKVGLMNQKLCYNCFEHVEHSARIHQYYNYQPVFGHFPDYIDTYKYIQYQKIKSIIGDSRKFKEYQPSWFEFIRSLGWENGIPKNQNKKFQLPNVEQIISS